MTHELQNYVYDSTDTYIVAMDVKVSSFTTDDASEIEADMADIMEGNINIDDIPEGMEIDHVKAIEGATPINPLILPLLFYWIIRIFLKLKL